VQEDLRHKILYERTHVAQYPEWYKGVITPEECGYAVREITDLPLFAPVFGELICHGKMLDLLETLFRSTEFSLTMVAGKPKAARVGNGVINGKLHRGHDRIMAVPLAQLVAINPDQSAAEAIGDWHYWVAQGYCF